MFEFSDQVWKWFREEQAWQRRHLEETYRRVVIDHDMVAIGLNQAFMFFLGRDGYVYDIDFDRVSTKPDLYQNEDIARDILRECSKNFPVLLELIEDQGSSRDG